MLLRSEYNDNSRFFCQNLVVCIRQRAPLTKFEKMWNSPCIAIEDPFDLGHNLGAGISRKSELELTSEKRM